MLSPRVLAQVYDPCMAAQWRGVNVDVFAAWLAAQWLPDGPPEPLTHPDAVSFLGSDPQARGPRWYAADSWILGYLPDTASGWYRVPMGTVVPGVTMPSDAPCERNEKARP